MFATVRRRRLSVVLALVAVTVATACSTSGSAVGPERQQPGRQPVEVRTAGANLADRLVIYNGRSHYGTEQVFLDFEQRTGVDVVLRGGSASELFQRLQQEGEDTPADILVTTDLTRLWRAQDAGLLRGVTSPALREHIPASLRAPGGRWWPITTRVRTPVRSTERVPRGAVTSYADLGAARFQGRTCLRTSNSEYNQSLVADFIAKRGYEDTKRLLQSWMSNDPEILGSDGELLAVMAAGDCDVGLVNHYYLARALNESDGTFPVAPAWPNQNGRGVHTNVSGIGLVQASDKTTTAVALMEYLTDRKAQRQIISRGEFAANPQVPPPDFIAQWAEINTDPIAVSKAGSRLDEATALMLEVGWE